MDEYAEEIWKERLSRQVDTNKIFDKQSLLSELNKLSNPAKSTAGNPKALEQLKKHINSLFKSKSLEKTITSNIFSLTSLRTLKKLSRRRPRNVRKAAIRRISTIIKFQSKVQEKRIISTSSSLKSKPYMKSRPTAYTKSQTKFLKDNASIKNNRMLALQFKQRFNKYISPDAIKAKKLRLKGTKK